MEGADILTWPANDPSDHTAEPANNKNPATEHPGEGPITPQTTKEQNGRPTNEDTAIALKDDEILNAPITTEKSQAEEQQPKEQHEPAQTTESQISKQPPIEPQLTPPREQQKSKIAVKEITQWYAGDEDQPKSQVSHDPSSTQDKEKG